MATPSLQQSPLLASSQLNSLFFSIDPDWGLGMFCGPNKRPKVVRNPLYKSVGGRRCARGVQWPKQLVFKGLSRSLATVTHGETGPELKKGGDERQGFIRTVGAVKRSGPWLYAGSPSAEYLRQFCIIIKQSYPKARLFVFYRKDKYICLNTCVYMHTEVIPRETLINPKNTSVAHVATRTFPSFCILIDHSTCMRVTKF